MDINIIEDSGDGKDFSGIKSEDVVILPAFGASVQEMKMLSERGVQLVDTTCPWVAKVSHNPFVEVFSRTQLAVACACVSTCLCLLRRARVAGWGVAPEGVRTAGRVCLYAFVLQGLRFARLAQVWNAVDNQGRKEHTSIIHGKYSHEETIATASFATTYLIVRDLDEAQYVVNYILNGGNREEFLAKFSKAISKVSTAGTVCPAGGGAFLYIHSAGVTPQLKWAQLRCMGLCCESSAREEYGLGSA